LPLRDWIMVGWLSTNTIARKPSYFGS